jgi:hypothetical protein
MKAQQKQIKRLATRQALFNEPGRPISGRYRPGSMNRHKSMSIKHLNPKRKTR